ncbi:UNVERIFIED_CONTAM: hypothetical protein NCL1_61466 [Trichonephila clavipes]
MKELLWRNLDDTIKFNHSFLSYIYMLYLHQYKLNEIWKEKCGTTHEGWYHLKYIMLLRLMALVTAVVVSYYENYA